MEELKDKGWTYTMEGRFLEIYNETITDLLSPSPATSDPPCKHEIHYHPTTPHTSCRLRRPHPAVVTTLIERSSHSHSVFTLRIHGVQDGRARGWRRSGHGLGHGLGTSVAGVAGGERLKEAQSIDWSLCTLEDVVAALGSGPGVHVPYRNSKLTYLLQNLVSGNSKTLMVLCLLVSPSAGMDTELDGEGEWEREAEGNGIWTTMRERVIQTMIA
ncbi:P-loop containing nucleoside triphosphate hydrolase protein [Mycena albidolilacea]|uniref:P-loop containing nucleoside triphosphate hydrolase protein n=1 Tax=Mycena albidolilacea TaxID=1033008 RepID=A0AAD7EPS7_9AGAR|nr:P-loop containing nucleoside triphosphate hydrolase protein [Mycena albidolilacea]